MTPTHLPRRKATPDDLAALLARQRSLVTPAQLRTHGIELPEQRDRVDRGEWCVVEPGLIGLRGVADSWHRTMSAVTLAAPNAAITAGTALRLHRVDGFDTYEGRDAVAPKGRRIHLPDGFRLWESRRFGEVDATVVDGIRTTTLAVALAHAAPLLDAELFGRAVDDVLRRGTSVGWLRHVADRWAGRGMPGSGVLHAALAERLDRRLPRSWFERLARRALAAHGVEMEHEVPVMDGRRTLAILDLAECADMVGVECQSWSWHGTPRAAAADAARKDRLRDLGWEVVELWWTDLHDVADVVARIEQARRRQRARRRSVA